MKKALSLGLIFLVLFSKAQNLEIPAFGNDSTLEVITWNIEWFPKNGETTANYVKEIIEDLNIDIVAMQELDDTVVFNNMLSQMEDYTGYYESSYFAGLAFIYNTKNIQVDTIYEILTTQPYWRPFPRSPMVMELTFMYDNYIVINNHFKCCGNGYLDLSDPWDEETRRFDASNLLEEYIRTNFEGKKVILTGDLNDDIADDFTNNVFSAFLDNPDLYSFTDMEIAEGPTSDWSYPTWPSHLDHILITEPLFEFMLNEGSTTQTLKIDQYFNSWSQYDANVTDHRPVAIKIDGDYNLGTEDKGKNQNSLVIYPNPTSGKVNIEIATPGGSKGKVNIYSLQGNKIKTIEITETESVVSWEPEHRITGIFVMEYTIDNIPVSKSKVVINQ